MKGYAVQIADSYGNYEQRYLECKKGELKAEIKKLVKGLGYPDGDCKVVEVLVCEDKAGSAWEELK